MFRPSWMRLLTRRLFVRRLAGPQSRRQKRAARSIKPALESLESRVVPTTFEVVGTVTGANQFTSLAAALGAASSGDTIQIESSSHPGNGIVNVDDLTIQGDPAVGASGLQTSNSRIDGLLINGANDTVSNVFADDIFLGSTATDQMIADNVYSPGGGVFSFDGPNNAVAASTDSATVNFSASAQTVPLKAEVLDLSNSDIVVNTGAVTFTVEDSGGHVVGSPAVSSTVQDGIATAVYTVPAGQAVNGYTIVPHYVDPNGDLVDLQDTNGTLTINAGQSSSPDHVTTAADSVNATFSAVAQPVSLTASVQDTSNSNTIVDEGTVIFTLKDANGNTIGSPMSSDPVSGGAASATYTLPAGQVVGAYTISVRYTDTSGNFIDSQDVNGTLTVHSNSDSPDNVSVAANAATVTFNAAAQPVSLTATVQDATNTNATVNEGTVTFTVKDSGGNTIGTPVTSSAVHNGAASAMYTLPAGQAVGAYLISVQYTDSADNFTDTQDTGNTLTVQPTNGPTPDNVTTTAAAATATFRPSDQTVALSATVADTSHSGTTVDEGTVTFTLVDIDGNTIGSPVTASVSAGKAAANYVLPSGTDAATYGIVVTYTDTKGNFTDNKDVPAQLTLSPVKIDTTASSATVLFNPQDQTIAVSGTLTNTSNSNDPITEGKATFGILDGSGNLVGSVVDVPIGDTRTGPINVSASLTVPGGLAGGTYAIVLSFQDPAGNYTWDKFRAGQLTVGSATTSVQLTAASVTPESGASLQTEILVAQVSGPYGAVAEGGVIFTVSNQTFFAKVGDNGIAAIQVELPLFTGATPQVVQVTYVDNTADFTASRRVQTIQWNTSDVLLPGSSGAVVFAADGSQTVQTNSLGSTLYSSVFDAFGRLAVLDFGLFNLSYQYNALGEIAQINFDGFPALFFLYTPQGQLLGII